MINLLFKKLNFLGFEELILFNNFLYFLRSFIFLVLFLKICFKIVVFVLKGGFCFRNFILIFLFLVIVFLKNFFLLLIIFKKVDLFVLFSFIKFILFLLLILSEILFNKVFLL